MACPLTVTPVGSVPNTCVVTGIAAAGIETDTELFLKSSLALTVIVDRSLWTSV